MTAPNATIDTEADQDRSDETDARIRLSVIMPCYNSAQTLSEALEALADQRWSDGWELLIADNGSTDNSLQIVEKWRPRFRSLRVIDASGRRGAPHARNVAAREATGDALLFCDADDRVGDGWMQALGNALRTHDFVAAQLVVEEINEPWVVKSRPFILQTQRDELMNSYNFFPWAGAGTMAIRKELFLEAGGFDEALPALEDVDFAWRVQLTGTALKLVPEAKLHYRLRAGLWEIYRQAMFYSEHQVFVFKKFRQHGLERPPVTLRGLLRGPNGYAALLKNLPRSLRKKEDLGTWLWHCGWRLGKLKGSLRFRYLMP